MMLSTRLAGRWLAPLAVAGLLAGCQSSRPTFQFAPAAPYLTGSQPVAAPPLAAAAPASSQAALAATPHRAAPLPTSLRRAVRQPARHPALARASQPTKATAETDAPRVAEATATPRQHRRHAAPAHTAESGLGGIGLFFIAVVLGVLAGLGALVSLIPGVSFLGGVGLAAAGLLVLFLLYSLVSGGKKKKK